MFGGLEFKDFEDGEQYLSEFLGDNYDDNRSEYSVITK